LQLTLARIAGIVGEENTGTPALLNTHRPDAFEITPFNPDILMPSASVSEPREPGELKSCEVIRLAIRLFRPALHARVSVSGAVPKNVAASGIHGQVIRSAGPWKTSGEWWAATRWSREEWDIALDDGALYRIYLDVPTHEWYVHGVYD
jgi:protein ImuB